MDARQLIGTWRLISYEWFGADGVTRYPLGRDAVGFLTYAADGHMAALLSSADRKPVDAPWLDAAGEAERAEAATGFMAYAGRFEVGGDSVFHLVEVSLYPNWIGERQERFVACEGPNLVLTTALSRPGGERGSRIVWRRA